MQRLILILAVAAVLVAPSVATAQDISPVNRMRIVLDLMKDGDVATPSAYTSVDLIDPAVGIKWVDPLIWAHRPQYREALAGGELTNPQKAALMLNIFRQMFLDARKAMDASTAADAARDQAIDDVETEGAAELGDDEPIPEG